MAFIKDKENKTIKVTKDCTTCAHVKVCKFHAKAHELFKTNEFYTMTKYLEWNNSLAAFELHASCDHYSYKYEKPADGTITVKSDPAIIESILMGIQWSRGSDWLEKDTIGIKNPTPDDGRGDRIQCTVTELINQSGYKFL